MKVNWSDNQQNAINARGGDILVAAAAGSGKTTVLTQRVLSLITDSEHPVGIDELLIVTFSRAAASSMRNKIGEELYKRLKQNPNDTRIRQQALLLNSAEISTIHSFCYRLIRENANILGLPSELKLANDAEIEVIKRNVLEDVINRQYDSNDPLFYRLVELLSGSRNDDKVFSTILELYDFLRNHPFYPEWVQEQINAAGKGQIGKTVWFDIISNYVLECLNYTRDEYGKLLAYLQQSQDLSSKISPVLNEDLFVIGQMTDAVLSREWDTCYHIFNEAKFQAFPTIRKTEDPLTRDAVRERRNQLLQPIKKISNDLFFMDEERFRTDNAELKPLIEKLFSVTLEFDVAFFERKILRGKIDYSDLEHLSIQLLYDQSHRVSALANSISDKYREILMDEYQDTNELQELIFSALSSEKVNRFMVGDVKQSIYGFRAACPNLFLEKKENYTSHDGKTYPSKIYLSENFRTRKEITEFVNHLFHSVMNKSVGEMNYTEDDYLNPQSSQFDYSETKPVEIMAFSNIAKLKSEDARRIEAKLVALKIKNMLNSGLLVEDKSGKRPMIPRDICILVRNAKNQAQDYVDALEQNGIGAKIDQNDGLLDSDEVLHLISYLRILKNPLLDLELVKVLCSPLYGYSMGDISVLRSSNQEKSLYLMMCSEDATSVFRPFLEDYKIIKGLSNNLEMSELLQKICDRTLYEEKCHSMPNGEQCLANIRAFRQFAVDFQSNGNHHQDFLDYLNSLQEYEFNVPTANVTDSESVSVMTIHHSKGLEFPIVFLVGAAQPFSFLTIDNQKNILLNRDYGFSCKLRDNREMKQHKTVPFMAMRIENNRNSLSEEMRLLYVALTRAKERLFIVASQTDMEGSLEEYAISNEHMPAFLTRTTKCYWDWIRYAIHHMKETMFSLTECPLDITEEECSKGNETDYFDVDESFIKNISDKIGYRYPYLNETITPRRISVSVFAERESKKEYYLSRRPKCLMGKNLTSAEIGTAVHKVMQYANLPVLKQHPRNEIERLIREGYLYEEEGKCIDIASIEKLMRSSMGDRLLGAEKIMREVTFLQEIKPEELSDIVPSSPIASKTLITGVVDGIIMNDGQATIIDYKTDTVSSDEELTKRYAAQIRIYRILVERQLNCRVKETILYSFSLGHEVTISE